MCMEGISEINQNNHITLAKKVIKTYYRNKKKNHYWFCVTDISDHEKKQ